MSRRGDIVAAVAAALPTGGLLGVQFATVSCGWTRVLQPSDLPAAIVKRGEETVSEVHVSRRGADSWALREMVIEVAAHMKHTDLDEKMDDYLEAIEQAVLYDSDLRAMVNAVLPAGSGEVEYDDEAERPVGTCPVRFLLRYMHWPQCPDEDGVIDDPYPKPSDPEDPIEDPDPEDPAPDP